MALKALSPHCGSGVRQYIHFELLFEAIMLLITVFYQWGLQVGVLEGILVLLAPVKACSGTLSYINLLYPSIFTATASDLINDPWPCALARCLLAGEAVLPPTVLWCWVFPTEQVTQAPSHLLNRALFAF